MKHIDGTRDELLRLLVASDARKGAEVGVADGKFSLALCTAMPHLMLYCVDPWKAYNGNRRGGDDAKHEAQYVQACERLDTYNAILMRMLSADAAPMMPDEFFDFVFIDGNHDYAYVLEDINLWSAKVKRGGIVAGHDYYAFQNSGVIEAVEDYTHVHAIEYTVIGDMRKHRDDNANPCWYWVKA